MFSLQLHMPSGEVVDYQSTHATFQAAQEYARQTILRWAYEGGDCPDANDWRVLAPAHLVLCDYAERSGEIFVVKNTDDLHTRGSATYLRSRYQSDWN